MELKPLKITAITNAIYILLIVPYGIETILRLLMQTLFFPFNRTLWN